MYYAIPIIVPPNTPPTSPVERRVIVDWGVLVKVEVEFPAGCCGLVGVKILYQGRQIFPTNKGFWFISDDYVISFPEYFPFNQRENELVIQAYNEDEIYFHTPIVRLAVLPREVALPTLFTQGILESIKSLVIHKEEV